MDCTQHLPPNGQRPAFSLIEVMVSVILISTVIAALLQLFANNTHLLGGMEGRIDHTLRSSLLLGNPQYGFERQRNSLNDLVSDFDLDDDFRRRLKATAVFLDYRADLQLNDAALMGSSEETKAAEEPKGAEEAASVGDSGNFVLEVGETSFTVGEQRSSWTRLRLQ